MKDVPFNDQRSVSDEQFASHLRLPGDAGKQLARAREARDSNEMVRVVAEHFRTRPVPRWPFYMHGSAWIEINRRGNVVEKANDLLQGKFRHSWPPFQTVDLNTNSPDPDWNRALHELGGSMSRNTFVAELSTAFAATGKVEYLHCARDLIRSFVNCNPFVLEEGFFEDHDRYFGGGPNNTLDCFARSLRWLDLMHSGALHVSVVYSDADLFWLIKQLWFYAMQYYRYCGDTMRRDNHHLADHGKAPFVYGVMFPEFSISKEMIEQGRKTIAFHFKNNVFKDGGYAEHCTKYQYHIIYTYLFSYALAKANSIVLFSREQIQRLTRWVEFNARACKPDGIIAEFGDEFGGSLAHLFCTLAAPVVTPEIAAMSRALGYEPGRLGTESLAHLTASYKTFKPEIAPGTGLSPWYDTSKKIVPATKDLPSPASIQYPHGGFTFFRSDWTSQADFLAISHYTDSLPHAHAHWDMMSFVLHTQGRTLIGDPATWLYTDHKIYEPPDGQQLRGYMYAPDAHNCLIMNDDTLKPLKALGHGCCWGGYPPKHGLGLFEAGGPIEVAEIWHDAYAPSRHRRFVIHLKGIGFAFVDLLSRAGLDLRPHQYSQRFHFEGNVQINPVAPQAAEIMTVTLGDATATIVPGREAESYWKTWRDERLIGIYGIPAEKTPEGPHVAELTRRIQGPSVFTTFLLTHAARRDANAVPLYLGKNPAKSMYQQHDGLSAHSLDLPNGETLLLASCPYKKELDSEPLKTDAELAIVVLDSKGSVKNWSMARGSKLFVKGKKLVSGQRREWRT
jgi:hypothetical protein